MKATEEAIAMIHRSKLADSDKRRVEDLLRLIARPTQLMSGGELERARIAAGLSLEQAACQLGIDPMELARLENPDRTRGPALLTCVRLNRLYSVGRMPQRTGAVASIVYVGRRYPGCCEVDLIYEWTAQPLNPYASFVEHSPDGFEWGYAGSGPAQLALAIVASWHHLLSDRYDWSIEEIRDRTLLRYQQFKRDVVVHLADQGWRLTGVEIADCLDWFKQQERAS